MTKILTFPSDKQVPPSHILLNKRGRPKNSDVRRREYLLPDEVEDLMTAAAKVGRHRLGPVSPNGAE